MPPPAGRQAALRGQLAPQRSAPRLGPGVERSSISPEYAGVVHAALVVGYSLCGVTLLPFLYWAYQERTLWEPLMTAMIAAPCIGTLGANLVLGVGVISIRMRGLGHPSRVRAGLALGLWFNFWWLAAWTSAWIAAGVWVDELGERLRLAWPAKDFGLSPWFARALIVVIVYGALSYLGFLITAASQRRQLESDQGARFGAVADRLRHRYTGI